MKLPEYLNSSYEGDDLFTGDQLRAAVLTEREACMVICDKASEDMTDMAKWGAQTCFKLIKARGNT
jgi:urease accessory protein UreE